VYVAPATMKSCGSISMERNPTLVGRGSGTTHQFEQSRLLCGTTGSLGLTIAEPQSFLPSPRKGFDSTLAPKGRRDSAQGFNPGYHILRRCAWDEGGKGQQIWRDGLNLRIQRPVPASSSATFRARRIGVVNPGLKPWAESFCPFGASSVRAIDSFSPLTFHISRSLANPRAH
jgi:hypothetical protein